jgi:hypothetical protein
MALESYTLEQAHEDIADLRGKVDLLTEILQTTDVQTVTLEATGAVTATGGTTTTPTLITTDGWRDLGALGVANLTVTHHRYRLEADGLVTIDIDAVASAGVAANFAAFPNNLVAACRPANTRMYCLIRQTGTGSGTTAAVTIGTGGAVTLSWPVLVNNDLIGGTLRMPTD